MRPSIATFYSYKGGVGRTVLAANTALALARRGKTLVWDMDVEAPGLHCIGDLRISGRVKSGFLEWLEGWCNSGADGKNPRTADLKRLEKAIRKTKFENLHVLPAHGDETDPALLYQGISWTKLFQEQLSGTAKLFNQLLEHLHVAGFRYVIIDSRTGLTDLGGFLVGSVPDVSVLVGGYGTQGLRGLARIWRALKEDSSEKKELRFGRPRPEIVLVASPIPGDDDQGRLRAEGRERWLKEFSLERESLLEIPFDRDLPFTEELLYARPERAIQKSYQAVADAVRGHFQRLEAEMAASAEAMRERPDIFGEVAGERLGGVRSGSRVAQGDRFEDRVAGLLRLLGYEVEPEQLLDSNKVDLVASIRAGLGRETYLVECKDLKQAVAEEVVETLKGWLEQPRARSLRARGMVVSSHGFSPQAIAYGKDHDIWLFTPEELERQLIEVSPYLDGLTKTFERSSLFEAYVTQRARGAGKRDGEESPGQESLIEDLIRRGLAWGAGEGSRLWVLLGDYGTGKTAFTDKLAYELAVRARGSDRAPVPLKINLRFVPNKTSLDELLVDHWFRSTGERRSPEIFRYLLARGRLVLLFDSFDEMGIATAGRSVVEQFRMLVSAAATAGFNALGNRVLVTCREQFFRDHGEALKTAQGREDRISILSDVALRMDAAIDTMLPFGPAQVQEFLERRLGPVEARKAITFMQRHGLTELGDRPQLLDLIIQSLPRLQEVTGASGTITPGLLYQAYTNQWLTDFKPTERQATSDQLRSILELLAAVLWAREGNRIHYGDLYALLRDRTDLCAGLDPNQLDVELRTAAFLSRTPDGKYGFSHRSFLEYFLARHLEGVTHLGRPGEALASILDIPRLSREVCGFLADLMPVGASTRSILAQAIQAVLAPGGGRTWPITSRINALWMGFQLAYQHLQAVADEREGWSFAHLRESCQIYIPEGAQLAGADLNGIRLLGIWLQKADLSGAHLADVELEGADLTGACLDGAVLRGADLSQICLVDARLTGVDAWRCRVVDADLSGVTATDSLWCQADFEGANFDGADFSSADLRGARVANARGKPRLHETLVDGVTGVGAANVWPKAVRVPILEVIRARTTHAGQAGGMASIAWEGGGSRLAVGGADGVVRVWDVGSGEVVRELKGSSGRVLSVAWEGGGSRLAVGGEDGVVRVWDVGSGEVVLMMRGDSGGWATVNFRWDRRGLWRGRGKALDEVLYEDPSEKPKPLPWVPRRWRASDLPELAAGSTSADRI